MEDKEIYPIGSIKPIVESLVNTSITDKYDADIDVKEDIITLGEKKIDIVIDAIKSDISVSVVSGNDEIFKIEFPRPIYLTDFTNGWLAPHIQPKIKPIMESVRSELIDAITYYIYEYVNGTTEGVSLYDLPTFNNNIFINSKK